MPGPNARDSVLLANVAANLVRLRVASGLSQDDFARELGYHRTYVSGIERQERNLTIQSLEKLADRLGVKPLELLSMSPEQGGSPLVS